MTIAKGQWEDLIYNYILNNSKKQQGERRMLGCLKLLLELRMHSSKMKIRPQDHYSSVTFDYILIIVMYF